MSFYVKDTTWKPATDLYVLSGAQWKQVTEGYVLNSGSWQKFWQLAPSPTYLYNIYSIPSSGGYTTNTSSNTAGTVSAAGVEVTLLTAASAGYTIDYITADNSASINGLTITIQQSGTTSVSAVYTLLSYELNMYTVGDGSGITSPAADSNPHTFYYTNALTLSAGPSTGSKFTTWTLDGASVASLTSNPIIFPMPANNVAASATFELITSNIFSYAVPSSGGSISVDPGPDAPGGKWYYTTDVTFTATPSSGWSFDYFLLDESNIGSTNPSDPYGVGDGHSVSAVFTPDPITAVTFNPLTSGTYNAEDYKTVVVTQDDGAPATNYQWYSWNGSSYLALTGQNSNTYTIGTGYPYGTPDGDVYYFGVKLTNAAGTYPTGEGVYFEWAIIVPAPTVSITTNGTGTTDPAGPTESVAYNSSFSITATPDVSTDFSTWVADGISLGSPANTTQTFTMPANNVSLTAVFVEKSSDIFAYVVPNGSGSIDISPTSDAPGGKWYYTTNVTFTATPSSGWSFDRFQLDATNIGSTNPSDPYGVGSGHSVSAIFTANPITAVTFSPLTSGTYYEGDSKSVVVTQDDGAPATNYQWYYWGGSGYLELTGENSNTYTIGTGYPYGTPDGDTYFFAVKVTNAAGTYPTGEGVYFEWAITVLPDP